MNPGAFHFAEPGWLWLAGAAPLGLLALLAYSARQRRGQLARLAGAAILERLTASHSPGRRRWKSIILVAGLALAGLALARPQWGVWDNRHAFVGEDVVFVVDCSLSMSTTDVVPNRLERAKLAVLDFTRRQEHGRVGLVAFAGSAFLQCPLTYDTSAFEEGLTALDVNTMPLPGTDIGRALAEADRAMDPKSHHKMVVLLTDGEDLEQTGLPVARRLATNGVVVFTVGVGTPAGKEISFLNTNNQSEILRDAGGVAVRSRLDEKTLREIATTTGGNYFPLGRPGDGLNQVKMAMHQLDLAGGATQEIHHGVDRYYVPLALWLLLLAVEPLIGTRKSIRREA
ncbi:MAG TPA: VWA domain-containing protein [Verrucomicrobiae bacterium]